MPIIDVTVGQEVFGLNEVTGQYDYYPVTATWSHLDPVVIELTISGEVIETTPEHPFYVDSTWIPAEDLVVGTTVTSTTGTEGVITATRRVEVPQEMYNLTVDEVHTYSVGEGSWLVHNACTWLSKADPKSQSTGQSLAREARDLLIGGMGRNKLTDVEKKRTTIAITVIDRNGSLVEIISLNARAPRGPMGGVAQKLRNRRPKAIVVQAPPAYPNDGHGERYLYDQYKGQMQNVMGVSHYRGPCGEDLQNCKAFFENIGFHNIYWDNKFVR